MSAGPPSVVVVGAGPWGLASAWALARAGRAVTLLDDGGRPAAHVAAGMLGARSEAREDEADMLGPLAAAVDAWGAFADALTHGSDGPGPLVASGALAAAARPEHVGELRRRAATLDAAGMPARLLTGSEARAIEPGLGPAVALALDLPEERQVEPRALLDTLGRACAAAGVVRILGGAAAVLRDADGRPVGVRAADGEVHPATHVVVAAGHAAARLIPGAPIRPVKGQILRLRRAPGAPVPLTRTIRTPDVYLAPRGDEVVVGATTEERADRHATAGAVADLLEDALRTCPELRELELAEVGTGLRPATADGRPAVGRDATGLLWALGGYRHGVLLTPLVAAAVVELVAGGAPAPAGPLAPFGPGRFAAAAGAEVAR